MYSFAKREALVRDASPESGDAAIFGFPAEPLKTVCAVRTGSSYSDGKDDPRRADLYAGVCAGNDRLVPISAGIII
jgi:hypothetical protein